MDYFASLRQNVVNSLLLMVGDVPLIMNGPNDLLLMKRSGNGCWGPPGRAVELGEIVETTARCEDREVTGVEFREMSLIDVGSGPEVYYVHPNGDEVHNITIVYLAHHTGGEVFLNGEHSAWDWYAQIDIPGIYQPAHPARYCAVY